MFDGELNLCHIVDRKLKTSFILLQLQEILFFKI